MPFIEVGKELDTVWGLLGLQCVWFKLLVGSQRTGAECSGVWPEGEDWEVEQTLNIHGGAWNTLGACAGSASPSGAPRSHSISSTVFCAVSLIMGLQQAPLCSEIMLNPHCFPPCPETPIVNLGSNQN